MAFFPPHRWICCSLSFPEDFLLLIECCLQNHTIYRRGSCFSVTVLSFPLIHGKNKWNFMICFVWDGWLKTGSWRWRGFRLLSLPVAQFPVTWIDLSGGTVMQQSFKTLPVYHYLHPNHPHLLKSWFLFRHHRHHHRRHHRCRRNHHRRRRRLPHRLRQIPTSKD